MIWRFYPFAVLVGASAATAVALLSGILGGLAAAISGLDVLDATILQRTDVVAFILIASIASSLVGGYVTAHFAAGEELVNVIATATLLLLADTGGYGEPYRDLLPQWVRVLLLLLAIPCAVAGGFLYRGRVPAASQDEMTRPAS